MNRVHNRRLLPSLLLVALGFHVFALVSQAEPWPRFRGLNGAGQSDAAKIPTKWTEKDYNWEITLPGIGHSSPVIWGDQVVVTSADPKTAERFVHCRRTSDGSEVWKRSFDSSHHHLHARNSFASSTPALDGERVYCTWATTKDYWVVALDFKSGETVWEKDLGPFLSQHGYGTSPIVYDGMVIVTNVQKGASFLIAFDAKTGREVWRRPQDSLGTAAYSVPCIYQGKAGAPQLISHSTGEGISSLDPKTGEVNWALKDVFVKRCVSSPVVAGGLIFGTCGQGGSGDAVVAVRPADSPGESPKVIYEMMKRAPYVNTPVAYKDMLFVWHDSGVVSCLDVASGEAHWRERVGGAYSGSPVRVGEHIYCISHEGEVVVLAASKEYQLIAKNALGEPSRTTPSISDGRMYLRTESRLMSLGGK